ncbi:MAG: RHS repeat protein, partial [Planctomycetes bacterium]|nr:RHS repeat protein [Planctomycetota bacterium]
MYILNWEDALVAFPGVIEYDKGGDWVELRAQVYGATVQSYSWTGGGGCASGANTYKFRFMWNDASSTETTNTVTLTATMTDQTTLQQTLTFKVPPRSAQGCPSGGGGPPSATWPAVLAPDRPFHTQELLASDSATRPYAISEESGPLYVAHALPPYNPAGPADDLLASVGQPPSLSAPVLRLTYSSVAAERRPIFINRYEINPSGGIPNTVSARLQFNGTWGPTKYYATSTYNPGDILQISLQADAGSLATGRYSYTFETTANYSGSSSTTSVSGTISLINEDSSALGEGWTLALGSGFGVQGSGAEGEGLFERLHIVTGGVILNQGAGNSLWFASAGPFNFTTPAGDFSTLVKNFDNTYTRTLKNGLKQNLSTTGLLSSIVDLNSNRMTFTYDGSNNLTSIRDPNNQLTTLTYSGTCGATGKACTITDPAGRITTLSYNASGQLVSIKDPDNAVSTFTYDAGSGRMTTLVDPRSNTSTLTYNFAGRVTTVTRPDSTTEQFKALQLQALCDSGECTQASPGVALLSAEAVSDYTDPRSNAWDHRLDWRGFGVTTQITDPLGQTNPQGHMIVYHRDSNGLVSQATDRLDRNTTFTRDSKGNPTTIKLPDGNSQQFQYNTNSEITQLTDELNHISTFTYSGNFNLTQITRPDPDGAGPLTSPITTLTYTGDGLVSAVQDARGNSTTFSYDSRDRVTQFTYPDDDADATNNPKVTLTYDSASNITERKDERGNIVTMTYDGMGRATTVKNQLGNVTTLTYDAAGNLTQISRPDPDGAGPLTSPITTLTYNSMNRRATTVNALNKTTTFTYDNAGNIVAVTDPLSRTVTFTYNELGQRTVITQPDPDGPGPLTSPVTTFTYDAEGQVTSVRDPVN